MIILKKIIFSILFIGTINTTFASFPITEKYQENATISEELKTNDSSLYGNLSLIFSILPLLVFMDIGFPGFFIFFSLPAIVFGVMSFETKGRIQGLIGTVIGFLEIVFIALVLSLWGATLGLI